MVLLGSPVSQPSTVNSPVLGSNPRHVYLHTNDIRIWLVCNTKL